MRKLGEAIFHAYAKDTRIYESNARLNGVLDTMPYGDEKAATFLSQILIRKVLAAMWWA